MCHCLSGSVIFCMGADKSFVALTVSLWTSTVVEGPWWLPGWEQAGKSFPFSICFLRMKDKVWQQGVKWERRQQLTCWLCLLKYHLTWKHEFLILTACFDHIFCVDRDLHNLPKFEPFQHQPTCFVLVLHCVACQRAGAEDCCAKGLSWPTKLDSGILWVVLEGDSLIPHCCKVSKANYMGPDPMSRLSERFWNGALADTETLGDDPSDQVSQMSDDQMTLRKELS